MRRTVTLAVSVLALVGVMAGTALANVKTGDSYGPAPMSGDDNSSCGRAWAHDVWKRTFVVDPNPTIVGGFYTFDFTRYDRNGTFVSVAGTSPGACDNGAPNGNLITNGIKGHFHGYVNYTARCASAGVNCYSPTSANAFIASCSQSNSCFTADFVQAAFGPGSTYGSGTFDYVYNSKNDTLCERHWVDQGNDGISETFTGDIATTCIV